MTRAILTCLVLAVTVSACDPSDDAPLGPDPSDDALDPAERLRSGTWLDDGFDLRAREPGALPRVGPVESTLSISGPVTITFDEIPAGLGNDDWLSDEYEDQGVVFVTEDGVIRKGLLQGDPGNWDLTGTNGDQFLGFNGPSYSAGLTLLGNAVEVSMDVSRSNGSQAGDAVQVTARCDGELVDGLGLVLGPINDWTTFTVSADCIDQITILGIGDGFHPYGVDNLRVLFRPLDSDGDGVPDDEDLCPDTEIPDPVIPMRELGVNRYALVDADGTFDTRNPRGVGPTAEFTVEDTGGCNAGQIADELGLGMGHYRFGLSLGALREWVAMVGDTP